MTEPSSELESEVQEKQALAALKTLGFTDPVRIGWLAEGKLPGTVGWALKVMEEARIQRSRLKEGND